MYISSLRHITLVLSTSRIIHLHLHSRSHLKSFKLFLHIFISQASSFLANKTWLSKLNRKYEITLLYMFRRTVNYSTPFQSTVRCTFVITSFLMSFTILQAAINICFWSLVSNQVIRSYQVSDHTTWTAVLHYSLQYVHTYYNYLITELQGTYPSIFEVSSSHSHSDYTDYSNYSANWAAKQDNFVKMNQFQN